MAAAEQPANQLLVVSVTGKPGGSHAILIGGMADAATPAASAGDLYLDPSPLFILVVGSLDGAGNATVPLGSAPASLVGVDFALQGVTAVASGAVQLTSLAVVTIVP